jgi:hypothetical protein
MAANSDVPPPYLSKSASSINVLVVGETQHGKSTLIKRLIQYAQLPETNIGIGTGNVSCTKEATPYAIETQLRSFHLVDIDTHERITEQPYDDLCDLTLDEAKVVPDEPVSHEKASFKFIDTPGLDDSDGDDMELMAGIVGKVSEFDHMNAVMYVRKTAIPFGKTFQKFFSYVQRSMPSLSSGLIMIHSECTTDEVSQFMQSGKNLFELRKESFKAATNLDLPHFFMDNDPSETSPFATVEADNEIHRLLTHLKSQRALPVEGMKLLNVNKSSIFWEQFVFDPKSGIVWGLLASTGNQLCSQRLQHPDLVAAWSLWLLPGTVLASNGAKCQIPHVLADLADVW